MSGVSVPWNLSLSGLSRFSNTDASRFLSPLPRRVSPLGSFITPLSLLRSSSGNGAAMVVDDNLHAFLEVLPQDLRHRLLNDSRRSQLVEVIMDLGRPPEARYLGEPGGQYLRTTELRYPRQSLSMLRSWLVNLGLTIGLESRVHCTEYLQSAVGKA